MARQSFSKAYVINNNLQRRLKLNKYEIKIEGTNSFNSSAYEPIIWHDGGNYGAIKITNIMC